MTSDSYSVVEVDAIDGWQQEADVVVVGLGAAGASAAIEARLAGAEVVVLERASGGGGLTATAAGHLYLGGGTRVQRACGFDDAVGDMIAYLDDDRSGAAGFDGMGKDWVRVRDAARNKTLRQSDPGVDVVATHCKKYCSY